MSDTAPFAEWAPPFDAVWFEAASRGLDEPERAQLAKAVDRVRAPLQGEFALTGEPLDAHAAAVTLILAGLGADAATRISAVLAVVRDDSLFDPAPKKDPITKTFGAEIATMVQGVRALLRLGYVAAQAADPGKAAVDQKEKQRKMLLAMAADLRIVMLRLASRLQSLRWYAASKTPCPPEFARETMTLYTPLANRLGIWQVKWEMEDLAFRFMEPETYKDIARQLEDKRIEREAMIVRVVAELQSALDQAGIPAEVSGRPKHIYSIWNKMRNKNLAFSQLYDLRAMRVIVQDERACYAVLAQVHAMWTPVSNEFDDYIARPKPNGYRSLHTVVTDAEGKTFEVQIRTREMHEYAEYGMAAHWRYKEAGSKGGTQVAAGDYDRKVTWMRQLLAWGDVEATQAAKNLFDDRIYVMTPQARVIELPAGATPVDFAYYLHTDLGHRCRGARVDGQMVPLLTRLKTGQTVEIISAKSGGPSRDWLNPQLGFLASNRSRSKVRAWFNAIELQERIAQGQTMVEKELQRLGKTAVNLEQLANQLGFARADDMYVSVAKDEFSLRAFDQHFREPAAGPVSASDALSERGVVSYAAGHDNVVRTGKSGVLVVGVDALLTQLARCCRPAPPDVIAGFITRGRGVSIHRADCKAYAELALKHPERLIDVDWGETGDALYPVSISIHAPDRMGLLRDLTDVFGKLRLNVVSVNTQSRRSLAHMVFTIEVRNGEQITRALAALNELPGVTATRS